MEKIDTSREWSRVAPTQRVKRVKHQTEERYPGGKRQQPNDDLDEKSADPADRAADTTTKKKKSRQRHQDHRMSRGERATEPDEDDADPTATTGRRIDIRI